MTPAKGAISPAWYLCDTPPPKGEGFSGLSHRATCGVSTRTTARLATLAGPGAQILHLLHWREGPSWEHGTMLTKAQDIDRAHRIARASGAAMGAAVYPAVLTPLPAYGTRLRGIGFIDDQGASRLVIELLDELAGTRSAHLLGLHPSAPLSRIIERLAYIARGARECRGNRVRGLVGGIAYLALGFIKQVMLAALQALPAARALRLRGLRLLDDCQRLIAPL